MEVMNKNTFLQITSSLLMAVGLLFLSTPASLSAQVAKVKIVVDASKDGGTWWFPQQKKPYDTDKPHKGKFLGDFLRTLTPDVVEIATGEVITDQLKDATVVVRFNAYGPNYRQEESLAYKNYVDKGGSVLLVHGAPGKGSPDTVADQLGIRFGQAAQTPFIKKWATHPITAGLKDVPFQSGSVISGFPESAVQLGMMINGQAIFGMAKVGKGKIIYIGSFAALLGVSQPLTDRIFGELMSK